jgi:hypothetical protein
MHPIKFNASNFLTGNGFLKIIELGFNRCSFLFDVWHQLNGTISEYRK